MNTLVILGRAFIAGAVVAVIAQLIEFVGLGGDWLFSIQFVGLFVCFFGSLAYLRFAWRADCLGLPTSTKVNMIAWYALSLSGLWIGSVLLFMYFLYEGGI